jgi:hypothetical protein
MNQVVMIIGNNNVFEVGSCMFNDCSIFFYYWFYVFTDCEALKVGDNNILECKGM